jgi:hypothetical protein
MMLIVSILALIGAFRLRKQRATGQAGGEGAPA